MLLWKIRNQDGGVEGHALTPSCENSRITTSCWTLIDRKTLERTKKDTPHPKTKEKPQWDGRRGAITAKSNPITAGWVTHRLENTYTTEVHPLEWRFWAPSQVSNLGVQQREEEYLENQTLRASGIWLQDFDRTGGNRDSTLGGHTQSSVCIGTQGKEQWPQGRLNQTYLLMLEGLQQRRGWLWLNVGTRTLAAQVLGSTPWRELSQSPPLAPPMSPGRLHCWVVSGQTNNKEGIQPHPSSVNRIKVLLSSAHQSNSQLYPAPVPSIRKLAQGS